MGISFTVHAAQVWKLDDNLLRKVATEADTLENKKVFHTYIEGEIAKKLKKEHPISYIVFVIVSFFKKSSLLKNILKKITLPLYTGEYRAKDMRDGDKEGYFYYCIETLINNYDDARYDGQLFSFAKETIGLNDDYEKNTLLYEEKIKKLERSLKEEKEKAEACKENFIRDFKELSIIIMDFKKKQENNVDGIACKEALIEPLQEYVEQQVEVGGVQEAPPSELFADNNATALDNLNTQYIKLKNNAKIVAQAFAVAIQNRRIELYNNFFCKGDRCNDENSAGEKILHEMAIGINKMIMVMKSYNIFDTIIDETNVICEFYDPTSRELNPRKFGKSNTYRQLSQGNQEAMLVGNIE